MNVRLCSRSEESLLGTLSAKSSNVSVVRVVQFDPGSLIGFKNRKGPLGWYEQDLVSSEVLRLEMETIILQMCCLKFISLVVLGHV